MLILHRQLLQARYRRIYKPPVYYTKEQLVPVDENTKSIKRYKLYDNRTVRTNC